jgi:hypothetical protein
MANSDQASTAGRVPSRPGRQHNVPYAEATMFGSYVEALRHLHTVGAPLRPAVAE